MANTNFQDAAAVITGEEQRVVTALKNLVDKFMADMSALDASNQLPGTFNSEGRNLIGNVRGNLSFLVPGIDNAFAKYNPTSNEPAQNSAV